MQNINPGGIVIKNLPDKAGDTRDLGFIHDLERSPKVGNGNPLMFLPGKFQVQRRLLGYNLWCLKGSDTTKLLRTHTCTNSDTKAK